MAKAARARVRAPSVRDDIRHRGMIAWKPVGRSEGVGDLLPRESQCATGNLFDRCVGGCRRGVGWEGERDGIRPRGWVTVRPEPFGCNPGGQCKNDGERKESAHL